MQDLGIFLQCFHRYKMLAMTDVLVVSSCAKWKPHMALSTGNTNTEFESCFLPVVSYVRLGRVLTPSPLVLVNGDTDWINLVKENAMIQIKHLESPPGLKEPATIVQHYCQLLSHSSFSCSLRPTNTCRGPVQTQVLHKMLKETLEM